VPESLAGDITKGVAAQQLAVFFLLSTSLHRKKSIFMGTNSDGFSH
jgi:hypothetical protein